MKVGSLCILIKDFNIFDKNLAIRLKSTLPVPEIIYTVREIISQQDFGVYNEGVYILLEEIVNMIRDESGTEVAFRIDLFREVQPPMSIADIFENELTEVL